MLWSSSVGVPGKTVGTIFTPVPVEISYADSESVGGKLAH